MKKIKLILSVISITLLGTSQVEAQKSSDDIMQVGSITANLGVGLGNGYSGTYSGNYSGYFGTGIGAKLAVERGCWQLGPGVLTLGLETGGSFSNGNAFGYSSGIKSNIFIIAARSAYHFGWNVPNLDTYAGVAAGAGMRSYDSYDIDGNKTKVHKTVPVLGGFAGASYFFGSNFGVNVEVGNDITYIQGGVILKIL
jgi:hypothetical protein